MIQILLIIGLITVCNAQYGEVEPPAPMPPSNYPSNDLEEISYSNKPSSSSENSYENGNKQVTQLESQSSPPIQLPHFVENVTCGSPVESQTTSVTVTQSTVHQISRQPSSKVSQFKQRTTTVLSSKPQSSKLPTRSSTPRTTRQTTSRSVTTQHPRITFISKRPELVVTQQPKTSRTVQITSRITRNQTSKTSRTTRLPSSSTVSRRPQNRPIQSSDCISDTLFVVDSTSSVRQFFEEHRNYIAEIINLILPEFDNEARIGLIEYSSPLRRQIKLPFIVHKNRTEIVETVKKLPFFAGITATGAALELALQLLQNRRTNMLTNVVVLTDGFSYDLVDEPSLMLHRLQNVRTFTVTVTDSWREYELNTIAGEQSRVFKGRNSVRELAKALTTCDNGLSNRRGSRRNNLLK
ncbi:unnamed protein product [Cercopithifilaria johnstoni]|uniref:VWFA domain-containing protein n=1 Tax=Cercopithifilaria johnstoni TaxID=2874296 RepID=A0A8J2MB69_9BILA|nr:unnamed protein product [Cercopithifilaria johnstoni]